MLWPGLFERHGGRLAHEFDLPTLSHISDGYTSGALDMVVHSMLTKRRLEMLKANPVDIPEIMQWLCKVSLPLPPCLSNLSICNSIYLSY